MLCGQILYTYFVRKLSWKRRQDVYKNAIRLRITLVTFARIMVPLMCHLAQPRIIDFVSKHSLHRESTDVTTTVKHFLARVRKVQRFTKYLKRTRNAYIDCFLPYWMSIQEEYYRTEA